MSIEARQALVNSPNTIFQADSQRADLLDPALTQTGLIAFLQVLCAKWPVEFTAIKSDHHDDSALGLHCHFNGYAADCWPLASAKAGDYLDAGDARFQEFLADAATIVTHYQTGLGGSAYTATNMTAAGPTAFEDDGADHVHFGAVNP